jgi:hypothetical protein
MMTKRTAVDLSTWRRKVDGTICGIPLGVPLPHDWAAPVADEILNPAREEWEPVGSIPAGTALDSATPPPCLARDDGSCMECRAGELTFFTVPAAIGIRAGRGAAQARGGRSERARRGPLPPIARRLVVFDKAVRASQDIRRRAASRGAAPAGRTSPPLGRPCEVARWQMRRSIRAALSKKFEWLCAAPMPWRSQSIGWPGSTRAAPIAGDRNGAACHRASLAALLVAAGARLSRGGSAAP